MALHGSLLLLSQLSLAAVLLLVAASTRLLATAAAQAPPRNCNEKCGDIPVPYPFGLTDGCYLSVPGEAQPFLITCDKSTIPPSLHITLQRDESDYDEDGDKIDDVATVTNIDVGESELQVMMARAESCDKANSTLAHLLLLPSYTISDKNKLVSVGCNKVVVTGALSPDDTINTLGFSGVSYCQNGLGDEFSETCNGFGCSMSRVPSGMRKAAVGVWQVENLLQSSGAQWALDYPCGYGFIVDERNFTFAGNKTFDELKGPREKLHPVLTNWAIGNENCEAAKKDNETAFACQGDYVECANRTSGGYICKCKEGYQGNPYLGVCEDINECEYSPCTAHGECKNIPAGNYTCVCDKGYRNDDTNKNSCIEAPSQDQKGLRISLSICLSFVLVMMIAFWAYIGIKKRKFERLRQNYFRNNGGLLLQEKLQNTEGAQSARIFTREELVIATNNFNVRNKIGEGGNGIVYKGILSDKKQVAVKVSKIKNTPKTENAQFINEVIILTQINHKNVVRLLGCCLETETAILVYEFISNGTLHDHIHKKDGKGPLSFRLRMKIAAETAGSLAYLHYCTLRQIVHRDVKTSNILLDDKFTAKVSDFGASKLIPDDPTQLSTLVQGTIGYLDPEYLQSNTLTEKSDVYSFGVVLVELITSQVALSFHKPQAERNLANSLVKSMNENQLDQILDHDIIKEGSFEIAEQVAHLARACLSSKGDERPSMKEVVTELETILAVISNDQGGKPYASLNRKETDYLLGSPPSNTYVIDVRGDVIDVRGDEGRGINSIDYDYSMQNQVSKMNSDAGGR